MRTILQFMILQYQNNMSKNIRFILDKANNQIQQKGLKTNQYVTAIYFTKRRLSGISLF
ncbi:hypothetical protein pb186bvf_021000, partial [Paramecium bursaria]